MIERRDNQLLLLIHFSLLHSESSPPSFT
jgi:hypothetical protein